MVFAGRGTSKVAEPLVKPLEVSAGLGFLKVEEPWEEPFEVSAGQGFLKAAEVATTASETSDGCWKQVEAAKRRWSQAWRPPEVT